MTNPSVNRRRVFADMLTITTTHADILASTCHSAVVSMTYSGINSSLDHIGSKSSVTLENVHVSINELMERAQAMKNKLDHTEHGDKIDDDDLNEHMEKLVNLGILDAVSPIKQLFENGSLADVSLELFTLVKRLERSFRLVSNDIRAIKPQTQTDVDTNRAKLKYWMTKELNPVLNAYNDAWTILKDFSAKEDFSITLFAFITRPKAVEESAAEAA